MYKITLIVYSLVSIKLLQSTNTTKVSCFNIKNKNKTMLYKTKHFTVQLYYS